MRISNKKNTKETKTVKPKPLVKTYHELHEFSPKKNYNVEFLYPEIPIKGKESIYRNNWINFLSYWQLNIAIVKDFEENTNTYYLNKLIDLDVFERIGVIKDLKYLIGYLVNRGPIILDDIFIYGIDSSREIFHTNKGKLNFSVIKTKLEKDHAISASIY